MYFNVKVKGPLVLYLQLQNKSKINILLGPTGAGKSSFIESLSPDQHLNISRDSVESVTQQVYCYHVVDLGTQSEYIETTFVLMDTPGFLEPRLSESRIARMVRKSLDAFHQCAQNLYVDVLYFRPITNIRIGGSKRHAVKMLREYVNLCNGNWIAVITTMWNTLSTPRQFEDADRRFNTLKNEVYASSDGLEVEVLKFDTVSRDSTSALSLLDTLMFGWTHKNINFDNTKGSPYKALHCDNLNGRIHNLLLQLRFIAEDKRSAISAGSEDDCLLEIVIKQESVALASLHSFVDDLVGIGPTGLVGLQALLDTCYEKDPAACSSPWPSQASQASPLPSKIALPADPAALSTTNSDIHSNPSLALALPVAVFTNLNEPQVTPMPTPSALQCRPDTSRFASLVASFKRRFNRVQR